MNILEMRRRTLGKGVYKETAEGGTIVARSLARMRPGLNVYGKSTQQTTTGAQLLDVDNISPDPSANDITSLIISDGGYEWEETSAFTTNRYLIAVKPNTNYTLSVGSITRGANLQISDYLQETKTGLDHAVFVDETAFSFNTGELSEVTMSLFSGLTGIQKITDIMLCEGTNVKPWEPYTGGHPSPSPDYPQEIENAGDDRSIQVDVYGGNFVLNPEGVIHFEGNIGDGINLPGLSKFIAIAPEGSLLENDISFSFDSDGGSENIFSFFIRAKYGTEYKYSRGVAKKIINGRNIVEFGKSAFEYLSATGVNELAVQMRPSKPLIDEVNFNITNLILNIGSTALPFEPYKQPQSLTVQTPNGLPGIPVSSGGNYTDENGQQWICDEIDFKRGKYVQRVKERIYGENENVSASGYDAVYTIKQEDADHSTPALSNMFIYIDRVANGMDFVSLSDYSASIVFGLSWITGKDAEAAKNWFAQKYAEGNPVKVLYVLATPIETDLSQEQMAAYANLHTNRPTTVVSATDGAGMKLTYKTKKSLEVTD